MYTLFTSDQESVMTTASHPSSFQSGAAPAHRSAPAASRAPASTTSTATPAAQAAGQQLALELWQQDLPREHGFEPLALEGQLPAELQGVLFRNGPGQFGQFGQHYSHPFEGDGAVTAIRVGQGRAEGAVRLTASAGLNEERRAGKLLYGMSAPWPRRMSNVLRGRQKNTANTSVVVWQGRLFALMEAALPTELDPRSLATLGETNLDGLVVSAFSAHPHRVAARHALYNFGLEYGRQTRLHLYELPDLGPARHLGALSLDGPPMLHDFIATDSHLIFFLSPVRVDVPRMMLQWGGFTELFRWKPELGTEVICVPLDRPAEAVRFRTDAFYQWHFANAFQRGGELCVDYVRYPEFSSFQQIGARGQRAAAAPVEGGQLYRSRIDLARHTLSSEPLHDTSCEFPTVARGQEGRPQQLTYLALDGLRALGKLDAANGVLERFELPASQRATEPLFVPRPGAAAEDDGWVLSLCHDGSSRRAFLAVFDAQRLGAGPVARAWFDHQIPITFHGTFVPARAA
jgi:all-trans-8'-apo-beta-carotenal 15,15'-oxygenase